MTVEELENIDKDFNATLFVSYANNVIKKLFNSITLNRLDDVDHFYSDSVFYKICFPGINPAHV